MRIFHLIESDSNNVLYTSTDRWRLDVSAWICYRPSFHTYKLCMLIRDFGFTSACWYIESCLGGRWTGRSHPNHRHNLPRCHTPTGWGCSAPQHRYTLNLDREGAREGRPHPCTATRQPHKNWKQKWHKIFYILIFWVEKREICFRKHFGFTDQFWQCWVMTVPGGNMEPSHSHGHWMITTQLSPVEQITF